MTFKGRTMALKRWVPNRPVTYKRFEKFNKPLGRVTKRSIRKMFKLHKKLKPTVKRIFSRKTLKIVGITSVVGYGIYQIVDYINSNSGCFLKGPNFTCKVKAYSCCQKEAVNGVEFCDEGVLENKNICEGYDINKEESCCRYCTCDVYDCSPHETMECQRPTVGEALTHFAETLSSSVISGVQTVFPWLTYGVYVFIGFLLMWFVSIAYRIVRRFKTR